jgi:hypothetical protein
MKRFCFAFFSMLLTLTHCLEVQANEEMESDAGLNPDYCYAQPIDPQVDYCIYEDCCDPSLFSQLVFIPSIEYRGGDGRGYCEGYETLGAFFALYNPECKTFPFLDLRAHRVGEGRAAGNVGLGVRTYLCDFFEIAGANIYYDVRRLNHHTFNQLGLGFELLGNCFDVRANGYFPLGKRKSLIGTTFFDYPGGYSARRKENIESLYGADLEIGRYLFCSPCVQFYGGIGPYVLSSLGCRGTFAGALGRVGIFAGCLSLQMYVTYDQYYETKVQGEIRLRIPFSCNPCNLCCWDYLFQPVYRNDIIVTDRICCWKTTNF